MSLQWNFVHELSAKKAMYIIFVMFTVLSLILISLVDPTETAKVQFYWQLSAIALIFFGLDMVWAKQKGGSILATATWESQDLFGKITPSRERMIIIIGVAIAGLAFFNVIATGFSLVGTPANLLQTVPLGKTGEILITVSAAVSENMLFFYFIMPTVFSIIFYITKNPWVAFILGVIIISPAIFSLYHFGVYGTSVLTATLSTWVFGLVNCVMVFIFRNPVFSDAFHISNNLSASLFGALKIGFAVAG